MIGSAKISPQEMVCQEPRLFETTPPSAYPSAQRITAATRKRSPFWNVRPPPECRIENPIAEMAPRAVATQKSVGGLSPVLSEAITAVVAGRMAMTTALWLAGIVSEAKEVKSGKPITAPRATTHTERLSFLFGLRCLLKDRAKSAKAAAMTVRAVPAKSADIPSSKTAYRVRGTVNENALTPRNPHRRPDLFWGSTSL